MHPHPTSSSSIPGPAAWLHAGPSSSALDLLAAQEGPALRAWLGRILRREDQADDAVQEVWVTLLRGGWTFQARSNDADADARAWLRQIALRIALNARRRDLAAAKRHQQAALGPAPAPDPLENIDRDDQKTVLAACLELLPEILRHAVLLRYHHNLGYAAIGTALGCTALTARMRTWRGLKRLRAGLLLVGLLLGSTTTLAALDDLDSLTVRAGLPPLPAGLLPLPTGKSATTTWAAGAMTAAAAGLLATAGGWWWHAAAARAAPPAMPWRIARDTTAPLDWFPSVRPATTSAIPAPADGGGAFVITARIFHWQQQPPASAHHPQVMDAAQWEALVRQYGIAISASPKLKLQGGAPGSIAITSELPFQAGFRQDRSSWIPCTQQARTGVQVDVEGRPDGDGTIIDRVRFDSVQREGSVARQEQVPASTLAWEEPRFCTVSAHTEHHRLRPTERLLVPPATMHAMTVTPGEVLAAPASAPTASAAWMVVSAEVIDATPPAVPTPPAGTS